MQLFVLPFILAAVLSFICTPLVRKLAFKIGAVDIPKDNRRVHKKPMPLIGGLAIAIGVFVGILVFMPLDKASISIMLGGLVILIGGIIDDVKELKPKHKMLVQIIAGIILIMGDVKIDFITNPFASGSGIIYLNWLSIPITLFWVVGITNTLNFIDGLDGLSAGVAMISSLSLMIVAAKFGYTSVIILAALVAGACLGFLPFNFNPAKIFMGDAGALFLGFMLSAISIEGVMKSVAAIAVLAPIIILGVPIFDTTFAIFRRLINGQSVAAGDKGHLHHRLLNRGFSQKKSVLILYAMSAIFGIFAILIAGANSRQAIYLALAMIVISVLVAIRLGFFEKR